ncbi:hypothetical protein QE152_g26276 [Popillia japonica]|uniref:Nucleic-acid-binding protein from transposon X-element n=1 Tax=Popillia japonica TaxID=7064 RepID=A0AAW1JYB9_POPJA
MKNYKQFIAMYKNKIPFYTYTPKSEKTHAYVIKGLPEDAEPHDIKQELTELDIKVHNVVKFRNTKHPIYMCMTAEDVTINDLKTKARYLQRAKVYYEAHLSKRALTQCKKCQAWGHATLNCHLGVERCVKCAQNHLSHQCKKDRSLPGKCANCGGEHPASSTECRVYIGEMDKLRTSKEKARLLREPLQNTQNPQYVPASLPPVNAWANRKQFPPLPVKKTQPTTSQQRPVSSKTRSREADAVNSSSDESSSEEDPRPSSVRRRGASSSGHEAGLRNREDRRLASSQRGNAMSYSSPRPVQKSEKENELYLNDIANTMREINAIVNLKKLSSNLKQLLIVIKKCYTPFDEAMAIHQFNLDNAN